MTFGISNIYEDISTTSNDNDYCHDVDKQSFAWFSLKWRKLQTKRKSLRNFLEKLMKSVSAAH